MQCFRRLCPADEDEEMFEEEDPGTSDEGATPQRGSKHRSCGGGAGLGAAGKGRTLWIVHLSC